MDFFKFLVLIIDFMVLIKSIHSIVTLRCKDPVFENGSTKIEERHVQFIEYSCYPTFYMIGNKYSLCVRGEWNDPIPICIKPGCTDVITPENGVIVSTNNGASLLLFCKSGYSLVGSQFAFCTGTVWNRSIGSCRKSQSNHSNSCNFEASTNCDWVSDYTHDFKWLRKNGYTSGNQLQSGPAYDHTVGIPLKGHFMLATIATLLESSTARLISPVYPANASETACFRLYYHMYRTGGALRVYVKPESVALAEIFHGSKYLVMDIKGSFSNFWFEYINNIDHYDEDFQIIIEASSNSASISNVAIDDVALLNGTNCPNDGTIVISKAGVYTSAKTTIQTTASTSTIETTTKYLKSFERITIPSTIFTTISPTKEITSAMQTPPATLSTTTLTTSKPRERITTPSAIFTTTPEIPTTPAISTISDISTLFDILTTFDILTASDIPTTPEIQTTPDITTTSMKDSSTTTSSVPLSRNETENDQSQVVDRTLSKESKILIILFGILLMIVIIAVASIITFKLFNKYKKHTYICNKYSKDGIKMEVRR